MEAGILNNTFYKLFTGSLLRVSNLLLTVIISFLMMPFVVSVLGDKWYGLWALIGGIIGYYAIIDFGILSATQRFFSRALHNEEHGECKVIFNTSSLILIGCSIVTSIITLVLWLLAAKFSQDPETVIVFKALILIMGIKCAVMFPFLIFNGILSAALQYTVTTGIEFFKLIIRTILIYYYLNHNAGIIELAWITVFCELAGYIVIAYHAFKSFPFCRYSIAHIKLSYAKEMLSFGKYSFFIELSTLLKNNIDTLIVSTFLTLSHVTLYIIPFRLFSYATEFLNGLLSGVMPVFATNWQQSEEKNRKLIKHFLLFTEISTLISTCVFGAIVIFGADFISIWMSGKYPEAYSILLILSIVILLVNSNNACSPLFYAAAKHQKLAKWGLCESIFKIIIGIMLIREFGLVGLAISSLLPTIYIQCVVQPRYACTLIGIKTSIYWRVIRKYWLFASAILLIRIILFDIKITESFFMLSLYGALFLLIFFGIAFQFLASEELLSDLKIRFSRIIKKLIWFKQQNSL
jgi:O-antigen/teichoic acid export membrane protein